MVAAAVGGCGSTHSRLPTAPSDAAPRRLVHGRWWGRTGDDEVAELSESDHPERMGVEDFGILGHGLEEGEPLISETGFRTPADPERNQDLLLQGKLELLAELLIEAEMETGELQEAEESKGGRPGGPNGTMNGMRKRTDGDAKENDTPETQKKRSTKSTRASKMMNSERLTLKARATMLGKLGCRESCMISSYRRRILQPGTSGFRAKCVSSSRTWRMRRLASSP